MSSSRPTKKARRVADLSEMEERLEKMAAELAERERQLGEEKRLREEEQRLRGEEQRRREKAEERTRPLSLPGFLDACHSLNLAMVVVTDPSTTTKGAPAKPTGRMYPERIAPWTAFPALQEEIWHRLGEDWLDTASLPSQHQMDYVRSILPRISGEQELRYYERSAVENAVQRLSASVGDSADLRTRLGLRGAVTFQSHTNLPTPGGFDMMPEAPAAAEPPSLSGDGGNAPGKDYNYASWHNRPRIKTGSGQGNPADQFCIYQAAEGLEVPTMAIEYKPPHKLTQEEVTTGLQGEIRPARDVIDMDGDGFAFAARWLTSAVLTQLFSYMIGLGIRYGYVCTGEAFVFVHIPVDDPSTLLYYVCIPTLDVAAEGETETRLHRTAVAQVFAMILQSIRAPPPNTAWHDAAATLPRWEVAYDDVLSRIPPSVRQEKKNHTPYKAQRWKGLLMRSPIRTRSRCRQTAHTSRKESDGDNDDNDDSRGSSGSSDGSPLPPSPTPVRPGQGAAAATTSTSSQSKQGEQGKQSKQGKQGKRHGRGHKLPGEPQKTSLTLPPPRPPPHVGILQHPYCSHACLYGLAHGGPVDADCPNAAQHGPQHMACGLFLEQLREQLARDRGDDADATPLYLTGSVGSVFKMRLTAAGYTLLAKAVVSGNRPFLRGEQHVYDRLLSIQGRHVPVCVGLLDLDMPCYCNGDVYRHVLLLSWGGASLARLAAQKQHPLPGGGACISDVDGPRAVSATAAAYRALHQLRVLHGDVAPRNILVDVAVQQLMLVDFERSVLLRLSPRGSDTAVEDAPLGPVSPNSRRKRKRSKAVKGAEGAGMTEAAATEEDVTEAKQLKEKFGKELKSAVREVAALCGVPYQEGDLAAS